jgi:hypothetical protein
MPGARCARGLAWELKNPHERSHHRFTRTIRHSLRDGFNGFLRALLGDRALLPPSLPQSSRENLTPASGRQDHTTSPSASARFVKRAAHVHHIPLRVVTIAIRPSSGTERAEDGVIWGQRKAEYFLGPDWTTQNRLISLTKLSQARMGHSDSGGSQKAPCRGGSPFRVRSDEALRPVSDCPPVRRPFCFTLTLSPEVRPQ